MSSRASWADCMLTSVLQCRRQALRLRYLLCVMPPDLRCTTPWVPTRALLVNGTPVTGVEDNRRCRFTLRMNATLLSEKPTHPPLLSQTGYNSFTLEGW
jgi:hypothetical protein